MMQFRHSVLLLIAASVVCLYVRSESASGIRLVGGLDTVPNAGRVEVWSLDVSEWIAVCDNKWDFQDAQVVCRELGYTGTDQAQGNSHFADGNITNSSVVQYNCFGTESSLSRCPKTVGGLCEPGNTAGVVCTGPGYVGCYRDHGNSSGNTFMQYITRNNMTIEMCLSIVRNGTAGRMINESIPLYAGLQNGSECWYNLINPNFVVRRRDDSSCGKECRGNPNQTCGSTNGDTNNGRLSIYDVTLSYCVDPGSVSNGTRDIHHAVDEFYFGTIINVTCKSGFHLQGAPSIQCLMIQPYGVAWNAPLPQCLELLEPVTTDSSITLQRMESAGLPPTMPAKMELCRPNIGASVGLGAAFTAVIVTVAVLIAFCYFKRRRGADKSSLDQSPRDTATAETGVKPHPPRKNHEERNTTPHNNAGFAMNTIPDEDGEAKNSYETVSNDVTKRQSDGVGWEDNTLYGTSYPTDYIEVS